MAAPIGNANAVKGKMFYDKLRKRLTQEPHRLERIVNELITQAEAGEAWAVKEVIDRLDAILVYTLGERFKHTQAVGRLKAEHDLPPSDPAREATQIARLEDLATRADLDPEFAKKFLNFIIQEVIRHHEQHQETGA